MTLKALLLVFLCAFGSVFSSDAYSGINDTWCEMAQQHLEQVPGSKFELTTWFYESASGFIARNPWMNGNSVNLVAWVAAPVQQLPERIWCKMKSARGLGLSTDSRPCRDMNKRALDIAIDLNPSVARLFERQGGNFIFLDDDSLYRGDEWLDTPMLIKESSPKLWEIQSIAMTTPAYWPAIGGMKFCKFITPTGVLSLMRSSTAR